MKKDLLLQVLAGAVSIILGTMTLIYGVRFLLDESKGNVATCIILLLCCMASFLACVLICKHNMKKYRK